MAYNRWIYPDELYHHGVLGQRKGVRNGPPYPLDRSLSDGNKLTSKATGSPQGKKRTPARGGVSKSGKKDQIHSDYGDSLAARAKRKYEDYKKTRSEERARAEESEKKLYAEQSDRLSKLNITKETREKLEDDAKYYQESHGASKGSALKRALDDYEKDTNDIKEHGTADDVLKNRERFSKEDMEYISSRLEAEAKIRQFSNKPVEQIPASKSKGENLYDKGSAKDVYRNRTELTVEQLETVQRRLNAENKIGEIASKQVEIDSKNMERLKKVRDVLRVLGDSADSIAKIQKIFPKNNQNNQNNQNNINKAGKALEATRNVIGLVNVVREVSGATNANAGKNKNRGTTPAPSGGSGGTSGGSSGSSGTTRPASGGSGSTPTSGGTTRPASGTASPSGGTTRPSSGSGSASAGGSTTSSGGTTRPASAGGSGSSSTSSTTTPRRPKELPDWLKRMRGEL